MTGRVEQIRTWAAELKSSAWMADQLGLSYQRVCQIAKQHGIKLNNRHSPEFRQRCRERVTALHAAGHFLGTSRHPDFEDRIVTIMDGAAKGQSYGQVAKRLGVSRNVVAGMAHRNGIRFGDSPS